MKSKISEYTEKEFLEFVKDIYTNNKKKFPTEESHIQAVLEFKKLTEHTQAAQTFFTTPTKIEKIAQLEL